MLPITDSERPFVEQFWRISRNSSADVYQEQNHGKTAQSASSRHRPRLITLQHALEEADIDATVTWNEMEACQLIETTSYDLILVGDHPPELNAVAILDDLSLRGTCPPVLILRGIVGEGEVEYFCRIGAIGVVPKRDALAVLDQVRRQLASIQFKAKAAMDGLPAAHSWRAAS